MQKAEEKRGPIKIRTDNLHVGQEIKSYKELCQLTEMKSNTNGQVRTNQLEELSKYVNLKKLARGYIVEEIYFPSDLILESKSKSRYIKLIETLLTAHLVGCKNIEVEYTYKKLFQILCMANPNYENIYKENSYEYIYNNIAPIDKKTYIDFRRSSYSENKKKIKSALDSMQRRGLIFYEEVQYVCYVTPEGNEAHRIPTPEEMNTYLKIIRNTLESFDCDSVEEIQEKHLRKKFEDQLSSAVFIQLKWKYIYKKIKINHILQGSTYLLDKTKQNLIEEARKEKIEVNQKELNTAILNMINKVGENNYTNATKKLEDWERGDEDWGSLEDVMPQSLIVNMHRTNSKYVSDWNILSNYFIKIDNQGE